MKKTVLLTLSLLFIICINSRAQNGSKMNFGAALVAHDSKKQENTISLLVRGTVSQIRSFTERAGGTFRCATGDIASISIQAKNIQALAEQRFVTRIEAKNPFSKTQVMNDTMVIHSRVVPVNAGTAPLAQAYKGDDVVMGFIDTGIDYEHPDFKDAGGNTRIKFLWDQVLPDSVPPMPYNYGQEWTAADIDAGKATAHIATAALSTGHGTHVASVGAGNGLAINKFAGVAPNADIIFVAVDVNEPNGIIDATDYIYAKAALLGKPCVINVSMGDYYGSHDGKNLEAQAIKSLITAQPGRSYVAAAGNAGTLPIHLGYNVSSADTNFTWFSGDAYIAMFSDTTSFKNIEMAIGADKVTPSYSYRGRTAFTKIAPQVGVLGNDTIFNGANRICTMITYGDTFNGVNSMEYLITADTAGYFWRLMTTGTGKFDAWTFDVETADLNDSLIYSPLKKYKQPDTKSNMVSSYQCLDEVITVGNYTNRNHYVDYDTLDHTDNARIPGDLFSSSSHGPTRDGRIKPDICAPGDWTLGALVTSKLAYYLSVGNSYLLMPGGFHKLDGGTSNSSPGVAGIAALYLQMQPTANWQTVKNSIINCARTDVFTGSNLPDNDWGYGKADAFASMTGCATAVNNNSTSGNEEITLFPNPASKEFTVYGLSGSAGTITIYNVIGKAVLKKAVSNKQETITISLPAGLYLCTVSDGDKIITTKKLIISE